MATDLVTSISWHYKTASPASIPAFHQKVDIMLIPRKLAKEHLNKAAQLFASREDMIEWLGSIYAIDCIAEIGVGLGDFSKHMIASCWPKKFIAIDTFRMHELEEFWNLSAQVVFKGMTHRAYYEQNLSASATSVCILEGFSSSELPKLADASCDLVYIDAGHAYNDVIDDGKQAIRILTDNGVIVFNDYIMHDYALGCEYGVVQATNELIYSHGLQIVAFALHEGMFCDIALVKRKPLQYNAQSRIT
jgi:hypothetical protein